MKRVDLLALPWLSPAPADFSSQVKAADSANDLRALSRFSLNINQCEKLFRALSRTERPAPSARDFSLGIVSNTTTDMLPGVLTISAMRLGLNLQVHLTDFDQVMQVALGAASPFEGKRLDAILVALDEHFYPLANSGFDEDTLLACTSLCNQVVSGLQERYGVSLIVQTIPERGEPLFGNMDISQPGTRRSTLHHLNTHIAETVCAGPNCVFDVARLAETVGLENWFDPLQYHMAKLPFSQATLPLYGARLANLLAAIKGLSRKCLVFDLDNTIWGGVIGDDGLDGIVLGHGSAAGEAFLSVQQSILELQKRGIVLAVSSKNTHEIAIEAFQQHEDMLLKEEHIAVFQANWEDKASNINAIAKKLNIGLDALVFLDDNPVERQRVREALPEVAVPELPEDPAFYPRVLAAAGYFEAIAFSDEDRTRSQSYRLNAQRVAAFESIGNLDDYLQSLDMKLHIRPFDDKGLARIVQLINKTNQFNLTTRRHDEKTVIGMMNDPATVGWQARLTDTYGDNGMIAVIIARDEDDTLVIDTFLMSCRVLERRVEHCLMNRLVEMARQRGISKIRGVYIPTDRNGLVADLYRNLGFDAVTPEAGGDETHWCLEVDNYQPHDVFIGVEETNL